MDKPETAPPKRLRPRTALAAVGVAAALLLAGGIAVARAAGFGPALHHGHDGAMAHDALAFHVAKALDEIGATEAQKKQIQPILDAAFARHQSLASQHEVIHRQLHAALGGATVDRVALEAVRADVVSKIDLASKDLAKALADAADVLTPAQRAKLEQLHRERSQ